MTKEREQHPMSEIEILQQEWLNIIDSTAASEILRACGSLQAEARAKGQPDDAVTHHLFIAARSPERVQQALVTFARRPEFARLAFPEEVNKSPEIALYDEIHFWKVPGEAIDMLTGKPRDGFQTVGVKAAADNSIEAFTYLQEANTGEISQFVSRHFAEAEWRAPVPRGQLSPVQQTLWDYTPLPAADLSRKY